MLRFAAYRGRETQEDQPVKYSIGFTAEEKIHVNGVWGGSGVAIDRSGLKAFIGLSVYSKIHIYLCKLSWEFKCV